MLEMHSKQSGFTYSACETFIKNKERTQKSINRGARTASDKVLHDKGFDIAEI